MKKILIIFMVIALVLTTLPPSSTRVKAYNTNESNTESNAESIKIIAAKLVAANFIAEESKNGEFSCWDNNTRVSDKLTSLYNINDDIAGYMFSVETDGIDTGYIVISSANTGFCVLEYSYKNNSLKDAVVNGDVLNKNANVKKIYLTTSSDYVLECNNNKYIDPTGDKVKFENCENLKFKCDSKKVDNANKLLDKINDCNKEEINNLFQYIYTNSDENTSGGIISSPITYLKNVINSSYTYIYDSSKSKVLSGAGSYLMNEIDSPSANCCTLVALCNAMIYYRDKKNYSLISSSDSKLYNIIKSKAEELGYTDSNGLDVTQNNNLVDKVFSYYGYSSVSGSNNYLWVISSLKNAIDDYGPFIFSLANGVYYNHSVMVYGYKTYRYTNSSNYTNESLFLVITDGWNDGKRYLGVDGTGDAYLACLTTIKAD